MHGETLGLNEDEVAFYDALVDNGSATKVTGDEKPKTLAMEMVLRVCQSVTIDWTLRVLINSILRRFGYPPDIEKKATELILEQAAVLCRDWAMS